MSLITDFKGKVYTYDTEPISNHCILHMNNFYAVKDYWMK